MTPVSNAAADITEIENTWIVFHADAVFLFQTIKDIISVETLEDEKLLWQDHYGFYFSRERR